MQIEDRHELVRSYQASLAEFETAVAGLRPEDLDARLASDAWSVRQIIHHVTDTDVIAGGRLRLLLARDGAPIAGYGAQELAAAANPISRSVETSIALVRALHAATLELLRAAVPNRWHHSGVHEQNGPYSVETWIKRRIEHLCGHSEQISRTRGLPVRAKASDRGD